MTTPDLPDIVQRSGTAARSPVLDLVIPVYNEEAVLERAIVRAHDYLDAEFPFSYRLTVADNASADRTLAIAARLAARMQDVRVLHLDAKGRGRALKAAWSQSDAVVVAYMDVDLSTRLSALGPLVAPLLTGHSQLAIGSRLAHGAHVERSAQRTVISRSYVLLLHALLGLKASDAQCGFKAIRTDVARDLLPLVRDDGWFFDTELLILAERAGLRIHEVPVDWVEDPDSSVDIVDTAVKDLQGIARVRGELARGELPLDRIGRRPPAARRPRLRAVA